MFEDNNSIFYNGNQKLKKAGVQVTLNVFQQHEFARCMLDVTYFIRTYVKTISLDFGLVAFHLYPYQERMINHMHENRFSIFMTSRQMGKCLNPLSRIVLRNKLTGETHDTTIGDFYALQKRDGEVAVDEKANVESSSIPRRNHTLHLGLADLCDLWYARASSGE